MRNEERVYGFFGAGIAFSLIFWPLLNSILSLGLAGYWLFFSKKQFSLQTKQGRLVVLFCSLYLLSIAGHFYSTDRGEALAALQKKSALFVFPLVLGTAINITAVVFEKTMRSFVWSTAAGCLYCVFRGLFFYFKTGDAAHLFGYGLVALKNMYPFMLALCCALSLFFVAQRIYITRREKGHLPWVDTALFLFLFLFPFLLGNRNSLFFISTALLLLGFTLIKKPMYRVLLPVLFFSFAGLAVYTNPYLQKQWKDLINTSKDNTIVLDNDSTLGRSWGGKALRLAIWQCSWDVIRQSWLIGVGDGDVQASLQEAYERRQFYFASRYNRYNTHNQFIQEAVAHGITGLVLLLACICVPLVYAIREKRMLYALFLAAFAFSCLTESILEINKGLVWYSFFNAIFVFTITSKRSAAIHGTAKQKVAG